MNLLDRKRRRYAEDLVYREQQLLRSRLTRILKCKRVNKTRQESTFRRVLGLDYDVFRKYVELQFTAEMSWENHGIAWEIDHAKPICTATTVEEVHKLFHYSNLRPLSKCLNRAMVLNTRYEVQQR